MLDFRPVLYVNGFLLLALAGAMLFPALADFATGNEDWQVFVASGLGTGFIAAGLLLSSRPAGRPQMNLRQGFLVTVSAWLLTACFGALPFVFGGLGLSVTDAFFESMSGLTTTGSTILTGLDTMPAGILLWRSILQWLGGVGILVVAVALLPFLRIGGMQLFRMESSEKREKALPRISQVAGAIAGVYALFTIVCGIALWLAGMTPFEAVNHALTTLSTGGYSTSDSSVGKFSPTIQWIVILFMAVGGTTFVLFITPWRRKRWAILYDSQVRWYLYFLAFFSLLMAVWLWANTETGFATAIRHSAFSVVAVVTTTGYAVTDYNAWGGFAQVTFFVLTFIGGCTGSTSGGIKIFRWEVLFAMAGVHMRRLLHPHGIFVVDFYRQRVSETVVRSVLGFMVLYFMFFGVLAVALTLAGLDVVTALSGAATAISNVGPGLGATIGPAGNFQPLPDAAKWLMAFAMLLGRLEIFTVLVLFMPAFWRG